MSRFIFFLVIFLIIGGLLLHFGHNLFFLRWVGKLPGDFIIKKGKIFIYFPIVSAAISSLVVCLVFSLLKKCK